jgi:hypothetical protein
VISNAPSSLAQGDESTPEVRRHDSVKVLVTRVREKSHNADRCIVDNNVEATAMCLCRVEVVPDVVALRLVSLQRPGCAAGCPDGLDYVSSSLIVSEIAEGHRRPVSSEPLDDGSTNTA